MLNGGMIEMLMMWPWWHVCEFWVIYVLYMNLGFYISYNVWFQ